MGKKNRRARSRQNLRTLFGIERHRGAIIPFVNTRHFMTEMPSSSFPLPAGGQLERSDRPEMMVQRKNLRARGQLVCVISSVSPTSAPNMTSLWVRNWARPPPLPNATDPKVCCVGVGGGWGGGGRRRRRQTPANLRRPEKKKKDGEGRYDDDSSRDIVLGRAGD